MQEKIVLKAVKLIFVIAIAGLIFSGCATTEITSYVNPKMVGHQCSNILVEARSTGLAQQKEIEDALYKNLSRCGCRSLRSYDILFPGRQYSEAEKRKIYQEKKIDAILTAKICDAGATKTYHSFTNYYKIGKTTTAISFGGVSSNPWIEFEAKLYDAQTGDIIWIAGSTTKGYDNTSFHWLANSMAKSNIRQLIKDSRLKGVEWKPPRREELDRGGLEGEDR